MIKSPIEDSYSSASLFKCACFCLPSCLSCFVIKAVVVVVMVVVVVVVVVEEIEMVV
jgi:hypothetical protein